MNRRILGKVGAMALLIVLLLFALGSIDGVVSERQRLRDQVVADIARSSSSSQTLTGPLLVVPYTQTLIDWRENSKTGQRYAEKREVKGQLYFLPELFTLDGRIRTELRSRGIYEARLYHADNQIGGRFEIPAHFGIKTDLASYAFEQPYLALGICDIRGIENALSIRMNGRDVKFLPGSRSKLLGAGVHVPIDAIDSESIARLEFSFRLQLQGTSQLQVTPVGRESRVSLASDWPHPSFTGNFLPAERAVGAGGFTARWQTSFFATNLEEALQECVAGDSCEEFKSRHFGVSFVDPVDQYLKSERAIKYALLFIALTFAAFFLFEVLRKLAVHPVQYGLVGAALALFYLLLLSLSEHLGFALAYAISGAACVLLIGFYISHVLASKVRGMGFAAGLTTLYGLLYGLLSAEDYALLMGSLLVFALLAAVMVLTRRVDWFSIGSKETVA